MKNSIKILLLYLCLFTVLACNRTQNQNSDQSTGTDTAGVQERSRSGTNTLDSLSTDTLGTTGNDSIQ